MSGRARGLLLGLLGLLLVGAAVRALSRPAPRAASNWPTPQELDSLSRYLQPGAPAPRIDEYDVYLPAAPPERAAPPPPVARAAPLPDRSLSAILITSSLPVAIIDDQQVRPGDRLAGGGQVLSIERDRVVVREADGTRRTLRVRPAAVNEGTNDG